MANGQEAQAAGLAKFLEGFLEAVMKAKPQKPKSPETTDPENTADGYWTNVPDQPDEPPKTRAIDPEMAEALDDYKRKWSHGELPEQQVPTIGNRTASIGGYDFPDQLEDENGTIAIDLEGEGRIALDTDINEGSTIYFRKPDATAGNLYTPEELEQQHPEYAKMLKDHLTEGGNPAIAETFKSVFGVSANGITSTGEQNNMIVALPEKSLQETIEGYVAAQRENDMVDEFNRVPDNTMAPPVKWEM